MTPCLKIKHTVLALALAAAYPWQAFAASAGVAQFIAGDVNVRRPNGQTNPLAKGTDIESGQAIVTGATGRAQVKFSDGGLVSLQPNTEFKIANYVDQADPKEDRFLVDLLRGSMRAITGLIGKRNRENYRVTTTTATIGIRGSGFSAGYNPDGSLGVTAEKDAIEVCSGGTCVGLVAGESVKVNSSNEPPVRTSNRASVPTPPPAQEVVTAGNQTTSDGKSSLIGDGKTTNTGTFTGLAGAIHYHTALNSSDGNGTFGNATIVNSVKLDAGKALEIQNGSDAFSSSNLVGSASLGTIAGNDFIGWGNWATGMKNATTIYQGHYVVGQPTSVLPTTGNIFATYALVGTTTPTSYLGASGTLTSATLSVNFDPTQAGGRMLQFNAATSFGNVSENTLYFSSSSFTSTSGRVSGVFTGANASRAGIVYNGNIAAGGTFSGAAVFQK